MLNITIKKLTESFASAIPGVDGRVAISHLNFVVYIVFHFFGDNKQTSIAGMRRAMIKGVGTNISRGAFWERLAGNRLKNTMELLVETLMRNTIGIALINSNILQLLKISGILLLDSTTHNYLMTLKKNFQEQELKRV